MQMQMGDDDAAAMLPLPSSYIDDKLALVDALPYIDTGYDDAAQALAQRLIEEECKHFRPTKDYLAHLPPPNYGPYETDLVRTELARIAAGKPMEPMDLRRYQLPGPVHGRMTDPAAWRAAVDNSSAQLEAQRVRGVNLDAMIEYGPEMWRRHCGQLEYTMKEHIKKLETLQSQVTHTHQQRKRAQLKVGEEMDQLNNEWVGRVTKNYALEKELTDLETDISSLERNDQKRSKNDS